MEISRDVSLSAYMLNAMTVDIVHTFSKCNPKFTYKSVQNPKRILTKPSKGTKNSGYDNDNSDYILCVHDLLGVEEGRKYLILDLLGQGTFGQVVKCRNTKTGEMVAVKVIKNSKAYFNQSMMEVTLLEMLNQKYDPMDQFHITRMKDTFVFRKHLCIVFELMSINLYELLKQNQFKGLTLKLIKIFINQLLETLSLLHDAKIIHCDLKPENILLKSLDAPNIKVIDFGSACHEHKTIYTYIQSRFYRCPEVLLGLPYSSSIDMWSLGCIAAELFLGLPIFPGTSEYNQISRIVKMLGLPPNHMIENGKNSQKYFERETNDSKSSFSLKSMEKYCSEFNVEEKPSKKYFQQDSLKDIIMQYPFRKKNAQPKDIEKEMLQRTCFCDFVYGLLRQNPLERWTPQQARRHPFVTGETFTGPFSPPMAISSPALLKRNHRAMDYVDGHQVPDEIMSDEKDRYYLELAQRRNRANTLGNLHTIPNAINALPMPPENQIPSVSTYQSGSRFQMQEVAHMSHRVDPNNTSSPALGLPNQSNRRNSVMNYAASVFGPNRNSLPFMSPVETPLNESMNNMDISGNDPGRSVYHNPHNSVAGQGPAVIPGSHFAHRLQTYVSHRRQSNPAHMFYWANNNNQNQSQPQIYPPDGSGHQPGHEMARNDRFFPAYKFPSSDSFSYPSNVHINNNNGNPDQHQGQVSNNVQSIYQQASSSSFNSPQMNPNGQMDGQWYHEAYLNRRLSAPNVFVPPPAQAGRGFSPSSSYGNLPLAGNSSNSRLSTRRQSSLHFTPTLSSPLSTSVPIIPEHSNPKEKKEDSAASEQK